MTINRLIEALGVVAAPGRATAGQYHDHNALNDLALQLARICDDLSDAGRGAGQSPGTVDVVHAVRMGLEVTLEAHAAVERARGGS